MIKKYKGLRSRGHRATKSRASLPPGMKEEVEKSFLLPMKTRISG